MKWEGNRESNNVEDRRGGSFGGLGGRSVGIGTIVIALLGGYVFGINPMTILSLLSGGPVSTQSQVPVQETPANDQMARFVRTVLADTEDTWGAIFRENGGTYQQPRLVLFTGRTPTACGTGDTAAGPFYCPGDQKIYIDLAFYQTMRDRFHVASDFAQAYVIAHEVGHHVQNITGIMEKVEQKRRSLTERQANALSVRVELQADCFAGVWAHHANRARQILEQGDVESALKAASAIGDDALQKQAQGYVVPDSFTHGTSEQRMRWFQRGIETGDLNRCNTFAEKSV
ncbi:KPN_02809 family neutral zinc metallopeptidase [Oxalicibacterium faecigallinarum]|uniref:Membrane protein n=1 Tax=Oxalicibacterium faecigallinarum TaxID=573741 RepID=A0A8J3ASA4_9BURK|nr:neutral zinc metallopeptidase [Oxalicibacterium faecigallinarum]GGI20388.1 membrane protein [Oxalicibacterium faecigallinarum]